MASTVPIDFLAPPADGTTINLRGRRAELLAVEPCTRRNGEPGWLLTWLIDGRRATSGLHAKSVTWRRSEGSDA